MDELQSLVIRAACTDVITRYAMAVNAWDLDAFTALFTPDAVWQRPGVAPYNGRDEIRAFMASQPTQADRTMRHVNGGILVEPIDADHATAWSQTTVYDTSPAAALPAPLMCDMVVEYRDRFVRLDGQWLIERRDTTVVFKR